jgi:hypothetical protein
MLRWGVATQAHATSSLRRSQCRFVLIDVPEKLARLDFLGRRISRRHRVRTRHHLIRQQHANLAPGLVEPNNRLLRFRLRRFRELKIVQAELALNFAARLFDVGET